MLNTRSDEALSNIQELLCLWCGKKLTSRIEIFSHPECGDLTCGECYYYLIDEQMRLRQVLPFCCLCDTRASIQRPPSRVLIGDAYCLTPYIYQILKVREEAIETIGRQCRPEMFDKLQAHGRYLAKVLQDEQQELGYNLKSRYTIQKEKRLTQSPQDDREDSYELKKCKTYSRHKHRHLDEEKPVSKSAHKLESTTLHWKQEIINYDTHSKQPQATIQQDQTKTPELTPRSHANPRLSQFLFK